MSEAMSGCSADPKSSHTRNYSEDSMAISPMEQLGYHNTSIDSILAGLQAPSQPCSSARKHVTPDTSKDSRGIGCSLTNPSVHDRSAQQPNKSTQQPQSSPRCNSCRPPSPTSTRPSSSAGNPAARLPPCRRPRGAVARSSLAQAFASEDGGSAFLPASIGIRTSPRRNHTASTTFAHRPAPTPIVPATETQPIPQTTSRGSDQYNTQRTDSIISLPSLSSSSSQQDQATSLPHNKSNKTSRHPFHRTTSSSSNNSSSSTTSCSSASTSSSALHFGRNNSSSSTSSASTTTTTSTSSCSSFSKLSPLTSIPPSSSSSPFFKSPPSSHSPLSPFTPLSTPSSPPVTPAFAALSSKPYLHHPAGYAPMAAGFARLKISSSSSRHSVAEERGDEDFFFNRGGDVGSAGADGAEVRMRLLVSGAGVQAGSRWTRTFHGGEEDQEGFRPQGRGEEMMAMLMVLNEGHVCFPCFLSGRILGGLSLRLFRRWLLVSPLSF
ncbi:uncharacterized protein K489DRAFT_96278 [Dissoconium aciculare CBS 342.82]|uniref:Uncharacterized protein n=1 Tax=Dissoconium aciculare CBS 342.82 TaxID=1314786 RepID=A0A6J3LR65_9PEZI|nr:uncharacterized protein K489DRAFT_96278 [Dissoconium aciculare CBS 342.82]KAF1818346.1 hypothetical protein K489DRAFT_96278 [Dissoconium aciculare CBS 342.82]